MLCLQVYGVIGMAGRTVALPTIGLLVVSVLTVLVVCVGAQHVVAADHYLHSALHHFEVLHVSHLRQSVVGGRHRRSTGARVEKAVYVQTLGRNFTLLLRQRRKLFHQFMEVEVVDKRGSRRHPMRLDSFFEGTVHGELGSSVSAHVDPDTGVLTAAIETADEQYFIEPSHVHFPESHDFHMISYRNSDVKYNLTKDPSGHFCGNPEHEMTTPPEVTMPYDVPWRSKVNKSYRWGSRGEERRLRRRQDNSRDGISGDACSLHLVASTQFFSTFAPSGRVDDAVRFMLLVVDFIDHIYRNTEWNSTTGLGFTVTNVTVYTEATGENVPVYNRLSSFDSLALLELFSRNQWNYVCLAHLFTAVSLSGNRLGVAYIARDDLRTSTGGICSLVSRVGGEYTTANVGVSSYVSNGRPLLMAEARLVTAHELGHNWGSDHDPTGGGHCSPSESPSRGKYIMFPSAQDGSQANNDEFSLCSREMVAKVLPVAASCFIDSTELQCGNYEVEEDEECDAGTRGMINLDPCCSPQCRYKPNAVCSDVNEECCEGCQFSSNATVCAEFRDGNGECRRNVMCSGESSVCPRNGVTGDDKFVPIESDCGLGGKCYPQGTSCVDGNCTYTDVSSPRDSITCFDFCELNNRTLCYCSGGDECYFCCESSNEFGNATMCEVYSGRINLPDGTTCSGGSCDDGKCVAAPQDLLAGRLADLFTDFSINAFVQFLEENIVGSVCVIALLFWLPVAIPLCIYDWVRWKEHEKISMGQEAERELLDQEDENDERFFEHLMSTTPGLLSPHARLGLMRTNSRSDSSTNSDFFGADDSHFVWPATLSPTALPLSPTRPLDPFKAQRLSTIAEIEEETGRLNPEEDNILVHLGTSPRPSMDAGVSLVASADGGMEVVQVSEGGSWVMLDRKDSP